MDCRQCRMGKMLMVTCSSQWNNFWYFNLQECCISTHSAQHNTFDNAPAVKGTTSCISLTCCINWDTVKLMTISKRESVSIKKKAASLIEMSVLNRLIVVFKEDKHMTQVFSNVKPYQAVPGYCHYKGASAFIFSVKQSTYSASCNGWQLQWRHALLKCWYLPTAWLSVRSQMNWIFNNTAVGTSNLLWYE